MKLAVVGASGMVGNEILRVLEELDFPFDELYLAASSRSIGKSLECKGEKYLVQSVDNVLRIKPDIAIFSAGGSFSKEWAPKFAEAGCIVIDNSSAWRSDPNIPLVVPEINSKIIKKNDRIIANPNCSTIQMVLALSELHKKYKIDRIVVSTYQSITGTGKQAVDQLMGERNNEDHKKVYPHPIDMNLFPHGGDFLENGYTTEEQKLVDETQKIFNDSSIKVNATVVRVPVMGGHSESVNISFKNEFDLSELKELLASTPGVMVQDDPQNNLYPMPLYAKNKNEVFVGRIRRDETQKNSLNLWIVADNLRKGAATNAIQIAKYLISK